MTNTPESPTAQCLPPAESVEGSTHRLVNDAGAEIVWTWERKRWRYTARPSSRETPLRMSKLGWRWKEVVTNGRPNINRRPHDPSD